MIYLEKKTFPHKGNTLIYFTYEDALKGDIFLKRLNILTGERIAKKIKRHEFTGKKDESIIVEGGDVYENIIIYSLGKSKERPLVSIRDGLANAVRLASSLKSSSIHLYYIPIMGDDFFDLGKNCAIGFYMGNYRFDKYKSKEQKKKNHIVQDMYVYSEKDFSPEFEQGIRYGEYIVKGVTTACDLVNEPASFVHPETLMKEAFNIEKESQGTITAQVLDRQECERLGMGAFLGVAKGSEREPKFIILKYNPKSATSAFVKATADKAKKICLIGKSITFDSGGISLKPSLGMEEMKSDMAGGATVLGVFKILAHLDKIVNISSYGEIYGILPACENMPSGKALKPGDVVRGLNGKTAEVINTDAEGRLTLADAVAYAEKYIQPDEIIDLATLTGACKVALGENIAGLFGNNDTFTKLFIKITQEEGEEVWQLPLYKPYLKLLKSDIADLKNVSSRGWGGAITGALFIGEFVVKAKWIHIDIAGPSYVTSSSGIANSGATGWGVLSIISYLAT